MWAARGRQARGKIPEGTLMTAHPLARPCVLDRDRRGPLGRRQAPLAYRFWAEPPAAPMAQGELAREPQVAWLEAALLAADEPLAPRRLAAPAGPRDPPRPPP